MATPPERPDPKSEDARPIDEVSASEQAGVESAAIRALPRGFLLARLVLLAGVMGLAGLIAWWWNGKHHGSAGAEFAIFSMVSCTVSAGTALWVVGMTTGGPQAFTGVMSSILFRTLGPLIAAAAWQLSHPGWPIDNLIQIHVPLFLVSLTVETILVVDIVSSSSTFVAPLGKGRAPRNTHG